MMDSLILRTGVRLLLPLMLLFSVFILWRGHNEPGGGFVGGLICSVGFALHALAFGVDAMGRILKLDPRSILGGGLLLAVVTGFASAPFGEAYMTANGWRDWARRFCSISGFIWWSLAGSCRWSSH